MVVAHPPPYHKTVILVLLFSVFIKKVTPTSWTGKVKTSFPQSHYPLINKISISIWYIRTIVLPDKDVFMTDETTDIVMG